MKIRINVETLEFNLRQWFLDAFDVWGIFQGEHARFVIFAADVKDAQNIAVNYGIKHPKVAL